MLIMKLYLIIALFVILLFSGCILEKPICGDSKCVKDAEDDPSLEDYCQRDCFEEMEIDTVTNKYYVNDSLEGVNVASHIYDFDLDVFEIRIDEINELTGSSKYKAKISLWIIGDNTNEPEDTAFISKNIYFEDLFESDGKKIILDSVYVKSVTKNYVELTHSDKIRRTPIDEYTFCYDSDDKPVKISDQDIIQGVYADGKVRVQNNRLDTDEWYHDFCINSFVVKEYYCEGEKMKEMDYTCEYGCKYDQCKKERNLCCNRKIYEEENITIKNTDEAEEFFTEAMNYFKHGRCTNGICKENVWGIKVMDLINVNIIHQNNFKAGIRNNCASNADVWGIYSGSQYETLKLDVENLDVKWYDFVPAYVVNEDGKISEVQICE